LFLPIYAPARARAFEHRPTLTFSDHVRSPRRTVRNRKRRPHRIESEIGRLTMKIKELMTSEVITCRASDSTHHAAHLMWEEDCGALPVVDEQQHPVGMITDRDVCMAGYMTGRKLDDIRVGDVMSRNVQACSTEDSVAVAEMAMEQRHVRRLPVVDSKSRLVGILSLSDMARGAAKHADKSGDGLALDKVAKTLAHVCEPWCSILAQPANRAPSTSSSRVPELVAS
jgi:CBS domain-containing protein